ncbi:RagB/SusD family nutrient uptake outer membrane protein [Lutibacter sp. A64]|uniref:RagB/SusD family nutrient uptake outer membrane protein n=1 Tax=Lutibacter sp. A64 TaxID=2918526 RepID=UPI001F06DE52|nr:RagB/SusD family nutrient uptake outer membrane protein [Lutibacter sp. A64]UMB54074.1 RagB/SusD family nutrient uptake outer membrane protein [Lutibacter sp. A64]
MKNINFKYLLLIISVSLLTSCDTNDFLEEINPNEIAKDNYWRNLDETGAGLNATYKVLNNLSILNINLEALRADMGYPGYGRPVPNKTEEFYNQTYNVSSTSLSDKWQALYQGIFRANQVIGALEDLEGTVETEEWTSQMGQARFLRGLFHYYLYTSFNNGNIIIREAVPLTNDDFSKPLSPAEDVLKFIREDLEFAYKNLYKNGEYPSGDKSRVTSGAAATILGDSYLNELNYVKAMEYFDDVINNHGYALEYDMDKLFTTAGEFNKESILEINYTSDNIDTSLSPWDGSSGTNWLNQLTSNSVKGAVFAPSWAVIAYKNEPMDPLDSRNYFVHATTGLTQRNVPLRASAMIAIVEDYQTLYYGAPVTDVKGGKFHATAWGFGYWKHFTNHDIVESESELPLGTSWSSKNVTLLRLSTVMLMQAECKIKTGDVDEAIKLINEIRKRWGLVLLGESNGNLSYTYDEESYSAEELMQRLMKIEKPLETSIEGHMTRFLDFKRWEKSDNYGFKQRLTELSNEVYYAENYKYIDETGATKWKYNFPSLVRTAPSTGEFKVVDYEFDIPALNYIESQHSTYPIPQTEINSNPNINN